MKNIILVAIVLLASVCLMAAPQSAMAFGFGAAGSIGYGSLQTNRHSLYGSGDTTTFDETRESVGLLYDTNLLQDKIFNYRLAISYQRIQADSGSSSYDLSGKSFENDFGFAIIRNEKVRLWAGAELTVDFLEGTFRTDAYQDNDHIGGIGVGPVVGVNLDLGEDYVLCLKGGYMFLGGMNIFSQWEERYGFATIGLVYKLGGDKNPGKVGGP